MLIVIGVVPGESGEDAMALGSLLCAALGAEPLLVHVHPAAYDYASPGHVDAEWEQYLHEESSALLDRAVRTAERDFGMSAPRTLIHAHRSSGVGMAQIAEAEHAGVIVIGSAPGASSGRFQIGSTADQLLHGSEVPVALAPTYYRAMAPDRIGRIVVAFQNTEESRSTATTAADYARTGGLPLTLLTVLLRHRIYGSKIGHGGEDEVIAQLTADTRAEQERVLAGLPQDIETTAEVTVGDDAATAVRRYNWEGDEIFLLASARGGALRRVFLGDMTYKLVRSTPVPALVLPRHT